MTTRKIIAVIVNVKSAFAYLVTGLFFVHFMYPWIMSKSTSKSTWKTHDFVDIPPAVLESAKELNTTLKQLSFKVSGVNLDIVYRIIDSPTLSKNKRTVLFLHGANSSSKSFERIGTIQFVAAMGHKPIAVDLPGLVDNPYPKLEENGSVAFLEALIREMKLSGLVILSSSMSGIFSLPYLMKPDPSTCQERLSAFVAVSPSYTDKFSHADYRRCEIPTMVVYGTKDTPIGMQSVANLRNMPNSRIQELKDAKHGDYKYRPAEFHRLVYNFLLAVGRL